MTDKEQQLTDENKKHTKKNYPFLDEMYRDGWIINSNNKHILINAFNKGRQEARKEILDFIEKERDNGNIEGGKGFSAGLCLSELMKELKNSQETKLGVLAEKQGLFDTNSSPDKFNYENA